MPSAWQPFSIVPLGGLNLDENPNAVRQDEIITALNVWYRGKTIGTRPGAQYESESGGYTADLAGAIQGGVEYRLANDATRWHVVMANGAIHTDSVPTTVTKGGGVTVSATSPWVFTVHADVLYAAGGATTDTPWYWAGTGNATLLTINNASAAALTPKYIKAKWNRLYACGFTITSSGAIATDATSNPMTARYSGLNQPTVWPTGNTFAGTGVGGLPSYGDEYLTGFGDYTDNDGDFLMLLTNRHLYAVQQTDNAVVPHYISGKSGIGFGCVSQRAYASLGLDSGDAVYLSHHGIHSLRQTQLFGPRPDKVISWKIRSIWATLNRGQLANAVGTYWREQGVVVFAVPEGSDTDNRLLLILDVKDVEELDAKSARWTVARLSGASANYRAVTALWPARSSTGVYYLYGGTKAGAVFRLDPNASNDFSYPYSQELALPWLDFGEPTKAKTIGDCWVQMQPAGDYSAYMSIASDFGFRNTRQYPVAVAFPNGSQFGASEFGSAVFGSSRATNSQRVNVFGARGVVHSFRFQNSASNRPFYIAKVSGQVRGAANSSEVA